MLTVAHISDLHFDGGEHNRRRIQAVLDYLAVRSGAIDALVVTGDITDEGTPAQYEEAAATLRSPIPTLIIPGNHDRRDEFGYGLLGRHTHDNPINRAEVIAGALFLMCDSSVPGRNDGYLSNATLAWMDEQITAVGPQIPVFVCFHHPPVMLLMPFMDNIRQRGEERLAAVAGKHPNIVGFLCGHAHTGAVTSFAGRPLCIAPGVSSTLNLPCEGDDIVNTSQPAGLAFHTLDGWRMITHFRSVVV
ncbi:metallophosphoesterase [Williamsia phyllosphaerae]|uniref:3',5'-cyclic adenosine monophosphate phosphodiesterase CpdA n=1 Tax=Williamsia phyllosphaerae TaxID=885042 RepID=A0ABQ1UG92_9NOCA|nr:metallophosphoesterase [Williamsia phyllosphaerae]GGF18398.1 3',5'-cyclic adenosine monophosphate phosphodiesterase CpdA [Williamsia phyllosphaerae]